jgi:hypothetical protein
MWAAEQAGTNHGPTIGQVLTMFGAIALLLLALVWSPTFATDRGRQPTRPTTPPPCARHWPPSCEEDARGR